MQIKLLVSAAAIALAAGVGSAAAGVGSAAADENFRTLDGISAFDSLAGIQANPLGTDEMPSITVAHFIQKDKKTGKWVLIEKGHYSHYTHMGGHGVKGPTDGRGPMVEDDDDPKWGDSGAEVIHTECPLAILPCTSPTYP